MNIQKSAQDAHADIPTHPFAQDAGIPLISVMTLVDGPTAVAVCTLAMISRDNMNTTMNFFMLCPFRATVVITRGQV